MSSSASESQRPPEPVVRFECLDVAGSAGYRIGHVRLNRPRQINALNLELCALMLDQLSRWASDQSVVAVLMTGEGPKGFCGGGDVAEVVRQIRAGTTGRWVYGDRFFDVEYQLDALIHRYTKPFIVHAHGICFGGGVGLLAGASHRIVSDGLRLAMPEIGIGLYPDVGAGFFLNRIPGRLGRIIGLTGMSLNEADTLFAGLADYFWPMEESSLLIEGLQSLAWQGTAMQDHALLTSWLLQQTHRYRAGLPLSNLRQYFDALRFIALQPTAAALRDGLRVAAQDDPWFERSADALERGSALSAAVTYEYLARTAPLSIEQVLALDARLVRRFERDSDFCEGVRALLIDKDQRPEWRYPTIESVPAEVVTAFFV